MNPEELRKNRESHAEHEDPAEKLDRLVRNGEWMRLKDNEEYQELSIEGKIIKAIDAVQVRIKQQEKIFAHVLIQNPQGAGKILEGQLKPLRRLHDALGARMVGEYDQSARDVNDQMDSTLAIPMPQDERKAA